MSRRLICALCLLGARGPAAEDLARQVIANYAAIVHDVYTEAEKHAAAMKEAITAFVAAPDMEKLEASRRAWIDARVAYGPSEVFRFYDGPIDNPRDGVELFLNAWPVDEAHIDGIIDAPDRYPHINPTLLKVLNMRGGEANIATGWHAVEYLLWGRDTNPDGPGARPWTDYTTGAHAKRRAQYLVAATELLVGQLRQVRDAWAPGKDNYRRAFERDRDGVRKILTGMAVLLSFELAGERLIVPYETQDQEEEHSCFSDTTHLDFRANAYGILIVLEGRKGPGVAALAVGVDARLGRTLRKRITACTLALAAIPAPFDQAMRTVPGRKAILAAVNAVEAASEAVTELGRKLGYKIPTAPPG